MKLTISRLARLGGVNLETIRYYEREGLLPRPPRTRSGYRMFPNDAARRLRFIKRAQQFHTLDDGAGRLRGSRLLAAAVVRCLVKVLTILNLSPWLNSSHAAEVSRRDESRLSPIDLLSPPVHTPIATRFSAMPLHLKPQSSYGGQPPDAQHVPCDTIRARWFLTDVRAEPKSERGGRHQTSLSRIYARRNLPTHRVKIARVSAISSFSGK